MTPKCTVCKGSGSDPDAPRSLKVKPPCPHCNGTGEEPNLPDEEDFDNDEDGWDLFVAQNFKPVSNGKTPSFNPLDGDDEDLLDDELLDNDGLD